MPAAKKKSYDESKRVFLVDEFRTSCRCSKCESDEGVWETFLKCNNPRPGKEANMILRHGLVKCKSCSGLWNRDMNAARNIYKVVKNEINRVGRPVYLRRTQSFIGDITVPVYHTQHLHGKKRLNLDALNLKGINPCISYIHLFQLFYGILTHYFYQFLIFI
jgi:hypothetical protein